LLGSCYYIISFQLILDLRTFIIGLRLRFSGRQQMNKKRVIIYNTFIILIITILLASCNKQKTQTTPANESPSIASLDIPNQAVEYPEDCPDILQYPNGFTAVELISGKSVGGSSQGWTAMYRFDGSIDEAEDIIREHYLDMGWKIIAAEKQETDGYIILLEKGEEEGFTIIEMDPDDSSHSLIMSTFSK